MDVGQGDAILIQFPNGKNMLIDSGPPHSEKAIVRVLKREGIKKLDAFVSTHPDIDHIGGFRELTNYIKIKKIYQGKKRHHSLTYYRYLKAIKERGIPAEYVQQGDEIALDSNVQMTVLNAYAKKQSNNESSIVLHLRYGARTFLLAADVTKEIEAQLIKKDIQSDVLKIAHHGSKTSTSELFLNAVHPIYGVISFDKENFFGHPHKRVMARLETRNIRVLTTENHKDITFITNGIALNAQYTSAPAIYNWLLINF